MWVGRNARENGELLRRVAHGNDFFLHIAGRPGAVVILRAPEGKDVSPEALREAAMVAVFFSLGKDAGAQSVDYTHVKHVRIMGRGQGRFAMGSRRTLRVTVQADRLPSILGAPL